MSAELASALIALCGGTAITAFLIGRTLSLVRCVKCGKPCEDDQLYCAKCRRERTSPESADPQR